MRRLLSSFLLVGILAALAFAGVRMLDGANTASATNPPSMDSMNVDMDPTGNTAAGLLAPHTEVLGTIQLCARADNDGVMNFDEDSIDTLNVDVTAINIPLVNKMNAFAFSLGYSAPNINVTAADFNFLLKSTAGSSTLGAGDETLLPDSDGSYDAAAADTGGAGAADSGSGVLERLALEAVGAPYLILPLTLSSAAHIDTGNIARVPDALNGAKMAAVRQTPM